MANCTFKVRLADYLDQIKEPIAEGRELFELTKFGFETIGGFEYISYRGIAGAEKILITKPDHSGGTLWSSFDVWIEISVTI